MRTTEVIDAMNAVDTYIAAHPDSRSTWRLLSMVAGALDAHDPNGQCILRLLSIIAVDHPTLLQRTIATAERLYPIQ